MGRFGRWMLDHPWTLAWLAVMVAVEFILIVTGAGAESVRDLPVTP